uniref:YjbQ family protein n=1 Tax=candidate division WOR-3 bacterium TaxID=2052148 RepID=A0A7C6A838_UNCW3
MLFPIEVKTHSRNCLVDITEKVEEVIKKSGIERGTCIIYVPHTTAAVTINENYDPSVCEDIITTLTRIVPKNGHYAHTEGNADAHIKAAIIGSSKTVFFEKKKILFGTWQGIFFCEFDGPRNRRVLVKIIED